MNFAKSFIIQCFLVCLIFPAISFSQAMQPPSWSSSSGQLSYTPGLQTINDSLQTRPVSGLKISGAFSFGTGGDKISVGETTEGDDITICTGGGFGMAASIGYNFFSKVDLEVSAGFQVNWNRPECDNGDFTFSRVPLLATARYWIPTKNNAFVKLGGGAGYYTNVKYDMDVDLSASHEEETIEYDNAPGFHIVGEYEIIGPVKPVSFTLGVRYSHVTYNANGAYSQGTSYPVNDIRSEFRELKGGGIHFYFGFGYYF